MQHDPVIFVGLGAIGTPMSQRIAGAGFAVTGVDPFPAARECSAAAGVAAVASIADAPRAGTIVVMVATPDQLDALVTEASEASVSADRTWVIMSTVGPDAVRRAAARLRADGARVIDAPVTGGVTRATTGELVIFASGPEQDLAAVAGVLSAMGSVRTVGSEVGQGQSIKVVNQHLCSVHLVAAAEAFALGESLGLDKADVLDLVGGGAAGSWMLSDRGPRMLQDTGAAPLSTIGIFVKDSGLVLDAASASGADVPVLAAARQRLLQAAEAGLERRDDSRVIETYAHGPNAQSHPNPHPQQQQHRSPMNATTDQPLVVAATFHPAEGKREQVLAAMRRVIPRVHDEAGCNLYAIQEAEDGTIIMIEHWDSAALLDQHGAGTPVAEFNVELEGLLASPVEVTRYAPIPIGGRKGVLLG